MISCRLSARLYEKTDNQTYANAAELSAQFITSQLYNGTIILDSVSLMDCSLGHDLVTYNSGLFIEGLSVYADITRNATWTTLYVRFDASLQYLSQVVCIG